MNFGITETEFIQSYPLLLFIFVQEVSRTFVDPNHAVIVYVQGVPKFFNSAIHPFSYFVLS